MNFFLSNRLRSAVLAAILLSGAVTAARAEQISNKIPNALGAFQAAGLRTPAEHLQSSPSVLQAAPNAHAAVPSIDAGHAASTPMISYEHGQLTINAENVRLSDILAALHNLMGTEIDLPPGASDEKIWARLGPGPARKILSDLLGNTDLNYVIQGSAQDVDGIQSVTLTARADGKGGTTGEVAERVDIRRPGRAPAAAAVTASETPDQEVAAPPAATPQPAVAAEAASTAPSPAPEEPQPVASTVPAQSLVPESIAHPGPPASLNQEQMVQQLTNMYQQRKQLQPMQTGSTPN